jgi:tetratricopeptide (TPR) repeat protein
LPAKEWPLNKAAAHALEAGRLEQACGHARQLMALFPDRQLGYEVAIQALIRAARHDEAEAVLRAAEKRFGQTGWALAAVISGAEAVCDWPGMLAAAETLRQVMPGRPDGAAAASTALARMGRMAEAASMWNQIPSEFSEDRKVMEASGVLAEVARDNDVAWSRWDAVRRRYPAFKSGYLGAMRALRRTRRFDLAGTLLEDAAERFPGQRDVLELIAVVAARGSRWRESAASWHRLVRMSPDNPHYALSAAMAPLGRRAQRARSVIAVLSRLDEVHERFPNFEDAYVEHAALLREARRTEEGEARVAAWCAAFPNNIPLALARIALTETARRHEEALAQVEALRARMPRGPLIEAAYMRALSRLGQHEAAEMAGRDAVEDFPDSRDVLSEYARLASRQSDWKEAVARWADAASRRPTDRQVARELERMKLELSEHADAEASPDMPAEAGFFAGFESLGGSRSGCEFGMVQRKFGSEGIGLLRWTRIGIFDLTRALDCGFEGVGDEEFTVVSTKLVGADGEEYVTTDTRFGMESHPFINVNDVDPERMFQQTCRRLQFLRRKMLEDLKSAERIFVYKVQEPSNDDDLRRLFAAVRRHGDGTLLCVLLADVANPAGSIRLLEPGLVVGYISNFLGDPAGIQYVTWASLAHEAAERCALSEALAV